MGVTVTILSESDDHSPSQRPYSMETAAAATMLFASSQVWPHEEADICV